MKILFFKLLLSFFVFPLSSLNAQIITTVAGSGIAGYNGDNIAATSAQLFIPIDVAVNKIGEIFIADQNNNRVRKVTTSGNIITYAGTGIYGSNGDGGPATAAEITGPTNLVIDTSGNLFICGGDAKVRKINTSGIISTVAGSGISGWSGDNGPATAAQIEGGGLAVDKYGSVYFSDVAHDIVRKINSAGIISTIAGNGTLGYNGDGIPATDAQLFSPRFIATDNSGNIYISDLDNSRIRKINNSGIISTIAGTGTHGFNGDHIPAAIAQIYAPTGIKVDKNGIVYFSDQYNQKIRRIGQDGIITTIAGNGTPGYSGDGGPALSAQLDFPSGIDVTQGSIYFCDNANQRVRHIKNTVAISAVENISKHIHISPNPFEGEFQLQIDAQFHSQVYVSIFNLNGAIITEFMASPGKQIPVSLAVTTGIYLINAISVSGNAKLTIIKK